MPLSDCDRSTDNAISFGISNDTGMAAYSVSSLCDRKTDTLLDINIKFI